MRWQAGRTETGPRPNQPHSPSIPTGEKAAWPTISPAIASPVAAAIASPLAAAVASSIAAAVASSIAAAVASSIAATSDRVRAPVRRRASTIAPSVPEACSAPAKAASVSLRIAAASAGRSSRIMRLSPAGWRRDG
jgi:hypothetical protein